nr:MAG TPA: hypothetical protein [Bacteriophage sp.]
MCVNIEAGQGRAKRLEPAFAFCHRIEQQGRGVVNRQSLYNNRVLSYRIYIIYNIDKQTQTIQRLSPALTGSSRQ